MKKPSQRSFRKRKPLPLSAVIQVFPLPGLPEIHKGDHLARCIVEAAHRAKIAFQHGDVIVIAQKIVSKAEGRLLKLSAIKPLPKALRFAAKLKKDPRLVEVILKE